MALVLRNTFIDIDFEGMERKGYPKRSSSAPPASKPLSWKTWEPLRNYCDLQDSGCAVACDTSTAESEDGLSSFAPAPSDSGSPSSTHQVVDADGCDSVPSTAEPPSAGKVTLCLDDALADLTTEGKSDSSTAQQPLSCGKFLLCLDATIQSTPGADVLWQRDDCVSESSVSSDCDVQTAYSDKVTLCLDASVRSSEGGDAGGRTKLSSRARAFVPTARGFCEETSPPAEGIGEEIRCVIQGVQEMLEGSPDVLGVQVSAGSMGETTTVLAELRSSGLEATTIEQTLSLLKATLLKMASESETVYVLGYHAEPFKDTKNGFKATIGCVTSLHEHSACWDVYELGCCTHGNRCRWWHPLPTDLMQILVELKQSS